MKRLESKYRLLGGFGILIVLCLVALGGVVVSCVNNHQNDGTGLFTLENGESGACFLALSILVMALILLSTQCRYIVMDESGISFANPIFPFFRRHYPWEYFDGFVTTGESLRYRPEKIEATWLLRNHKVSRRISSYYYSNYDELINNLKINNLGKRNFNMIEQALAALRILRIRDLT